MNAFLCNAVYCGITRNCHSDKNGSVTAIFSMNWDFWISAIEFGAPLIYRIYTVVHLTGVLPESLHSGSKNQLLSNPTGINLFCDPDRLLRPIASLFVYISVLYCCLQWTDSFAILCSYDEPGTTDVQNSPDRILYSVFLFLFAEPRRIVCSHLAAPQRPQARFSRSTSSYAEEEVVK